MSYTWENPNIRPDVSVINNEPKPTSPPNTSPVNTEPDVTTDMFGNVVAEVDIRGRQQPFSTVKTPKQFNFNRRRGNNNNRRGFIQPRNFG